jgi:hypothetical protein
MRDFCANALLFQDFGRASQMPSTTKRLDLRFGLFACSVQGFDDPVMPVQQILRAIQHLLEESPELSDSGISFDAEAVESLVEEIARRADLDSEDIEITPGLVIVHRGENDISARARRAPVSRDIADSEHAAHDANGEAWAQSYSAGEEPEAEDVAQGTPGPAYVNIFAARGGAADRRAGDDGEASARKLRDTSGASDADPADDLEPETQERLRDIFADTVGDPDGSLFADSDGSDENDDRPLNLFARSEDRTGDTGGTGDTMFGAFELRGDSAPGAGEHGAGIGAGQTEQSDFGDGGSAAAPEGVDESYTVAGLVQAASATTVPDMMICSAAWMVLLQGKVSFTRREVLDVFDQIPGDHEKTLEARIKGFGKATRNGQLVAVEDGLFGLSQEELERFERLL